jgi:alpha-N-arabinofuranosidase
MVIKAINVSPNPVSGAIHVAGLSNFASQGDVTVISSARLTDNNTMSNPKKVIPVTGQINISGGSFNCDFPANSFTLIRLKAR